jgi:uncharacterized membrane protein HdeD (DUF308 family)
MAFLGISIAVTSGILAILAGLLVLVWPKLIRIALGFYLIVVGILQLLG